MSPSPAPVPPSPPAADAPLTDWLDQRAVTQPDALAYRFLHDGELSFSELSWSELRNQARSRAAGLIERGLGGQPVLVTEPPGLDFLTGLMACWYAGAIAVPAYPPRGKRHRQRLAAILHDCGARVALGDAEVEGVELLRAVDFAEAADISPPPGAAGAPCLLQYTSGSTAAPKGVVLHARHLRHHLSVLGDDVRRMSIGSTLSWLPPYHDMGLVLKLLLTLESGIPLTFFSPDHFVQRPVRWLRAISRFRAELSGAPNFAFEHCLRSIRDEELDGLDLSCWRAAPTGAERVRADTLERFARRFGKWGFDPTCLMPGYGLAEATLTVTACPAGRELRLSTHPTGGRHVSCGPPLPGTQLRIADPISGDTLPPGEIGEIRVRGESVAGGYWQRAEETLLSFGDDGELRTGDRGYLENGELHVVGRIKDLIILNGANLAPEDIESTISAAFPDLPAVAAFADSTAESEGIALAVEAPRGGGAELAAALRRTVADALELEIQRIIQVRPGTLPRTTSGKVRRSATRDALRRGALAVTHDDAAQPSSVAPTGESTLAQVLAAVAEASGRDGARAEDDLVGFGLSSIEATRLAALLRGSTGVAVPLSDLFAVRSFAELSAMLDRGVAEPLPAISPGSGRDAGVMTHSQERMGFLHQLDPESAAYHVFGTLEMTGPLDLLALENAYHAVISRHAILRSRHPVIDGIQVTRSCDAPPPPLERADDEAALGEFALRPYDLACDSPVRGMVVSLGKERHIFALCAHHIVADGWSVRVIVRELAAYYAGHSLPAPALEYADYAAWHRRWIDSGAVDDQLRYWKSRLAGHSGSMELVTDFPRPPRMTSAGGAVRREIPAALSARIAAVARTARATPFMVQLAAFHLMLSRHGAGDDQVLAVPVANRHHPDAAGLVGTLVNTLPFRMELHAEESFATLLGRVRDQTFAMQANQDAPFERIIEAVRPERLRDRSPLAQVMFDHQEIPFPEAWRGGLGCRPYLVHRGAVQFDLALMWFVLPDRQGAVLEFRSDLFLPETAAALLDRYLATLEQACAAPDSPLGANDGLAPADAPRLRRLGAGPERPAFPRQSTPDLIAATCARLPRHTAVVCGGASLDYAGLDALSSSLAARLTAAGVMPGDRVAQLVERDIHLPATLLAVWKAGATYVPLDAANPPERLALILADQAPVHVVVSPALAGHLPPGTSAIVLDPTQPTPGAPDPPHATRPEDPAYILYTSGSTGRPKGVVVSHGALANFLLSMREKPGISEGDRLLALTTVSFDISALELFLPLVAGATIDLALPCQARDPAWLIERIESTRPQVMQATPATWRMLLDAGWSGAPWMKLLCGGEAMDLPLATRLQPLGCELWNLYGPTETTVWSTLWRVPAHPQRIHIGEPIANTGLRIADAAGASVPPGAVGELWISGAGLADGYWQRPELTAQRFVEHPGDTASPGGRYYRTGDLARWHADGSLECLGRSDGQVKIRGFRVELGEIEAALAAHPAVAEAAVALVGERLIGWFRASGEVPDTGEIADFLRSRLPAYMIPAPILAVEEMPLTTSGKIDRKALAARPLPACQPPEMPAVHDPLAAELGAIWSEILECGAVGVDDDFFQLGGHSLAAARLVAEVARRTGVSVPLDWLFDRPTPSGMAAQMRERAADDLAEPRVIPLSRERGGPPIFWCHTLVDGGMGLLPYRETARLLGGWTDSYGIAEGTRTFDSLAAMAAVHVAKIRAAQPRGPYRLAGFCFGGNLAAEVASQLADAGEEIELLFLLEAAPPRPSTPGQAWRHPATWARMAARLPGRIRSLMARNFDGVLRRLRMKSHAAASRFTGTPGIPDIRGVLDVEALEPALRARAEAHWVALHRHPSRLPARGRIVLIRAGDDGWLPRPPHLGWDAPGGMEDVIVPGRHEDFLRQHSAAEVAEVMARILSR